MEVGLLQPGATDGAGNVPAPVVLVHSAAKSLDPGGAGRIGCERSVKIAGGQAGQAVLAAIEDRGVRGCVLCCGGLELPLTFADIKCNAASVTVTVHAAVHPGCQHKGTPLEFTCGGGGEEADLWQREMVGAIERTNNMHWGISRSLIREHKDRWEAEGQRCHGMTVAEYFQDVGLGHVYDETWQWCSDVLAGLEGKETKSVADWKSIAYFKNKVYKTESYEDMELTDYMNLLKHQDLVPAGQQVSYASFIAEDSDSSGRRKVGTATVFVSHVWKMTAMDFFEVCLAEMTDEDYAWIDLYCHNQYQGAVSSIGNENSTYWIDKFGQLIAGIGKVIAIVTDWEGPVMLTRIWCLFELNAAIEMHADLCFVATAAQRQELSLNLNKKFSQLDGILSSIDVRDCDAKRPHEIQDKAIFLGRLEGIEDEVNGKLRKEMQRWLCDAADNVLYRTDPHRPKLDEAEMTLELQATGKAAARKTQCMEQWPCILPLLGWLDSVLMAAAFYLFGAVGTTAGLWGWSALGLAVFGVVLLFLGGPFKETLQPWVLVATAVFVALSLWLGLPSSRGVWAWAALLMGAAAMIMWLGPTRHFEEHREARQLRHPPLCGGIVQNALGTYRDAIYKWSKIITMSIAPLGLWWFVGWQMALFAVPAGYFVASALTAPLDDRAAEVIFRSSLCIKVGWLRLGAGDAEDAVCIFVQAHEELSRHFGLHASAFSAVAGHVRALCDARRREEAEAVAARVPQFEDCEGVLMRAGIAAALRAPDADIVALLHQAATAKWSEDIEGKGHYINQPCFIPAGSRRGGMGWDDVQRVEPGLPEWHEFLARMVSGGGASDEDRAAWDAYCALTIETMRLYRAKVDAGCTAEELDQHLHPEEYWDDLDPHSTRDASIGQLPYGSSARELQDRGLPFEDCDDDTRRLRLLQSDFGHPAFTRALKNAGLCAG
jgi:hypothetical protein